MNILQFMHDDEGKWYGLDLDKMVCFKWQEKKQILELFIGGQKVMIKGEKALTVYERMRKQLDIKWP